MKFLISDYSSYSTTEPIYFNNTLNSIGCISTLWNHNKFSTYDMFDIAKPDIYLTHYLALSNETITYLGENNNIDFILNITNIKDNDFNRLCDILSDHNIKPKFFFNNNCSQKLNSRKINVVNIAHGADIYMNGEKYPYNIDYGIFVNDPKQMVAVGDTYHFLSNNKKLENIADIVLPNIALCSIYKNYKNIVFKYYDGYFDQTFFDAAYYGNHIFVSIDNRSDLESSLSKMFGQTNVCSLLDMNSGNINNIIKTKHTCLNRTKSLLSQLSSKEYVDKLSLIIEGKQI